MPPNLDHIAPQLRPLAVPVAKLAPDPKNARVHNERNLAAIRESFRKFGQDLPLVVQKKGMVVRVGNGRLAVARELGWTHIAAVVVEGDPSAMVERALADNRSAELAEWDYRLLADVFRELRTAEVDLSNLGWMDYEYEPLLQAEWNPPPIADLPAKPAHAAAHSVSFTPEQWAEVRAAAGEEDPAAFLAGLCRKVNARRAAQKGSA